MNEYKVKIKNINEITHNVKRFVVERPENYSFNPGQATEVAINLGGWKEERRPFTFTSLKEDPDLEFIIKIYEDHNGVTRQLGRTLPGQELLLHDVWGTIRYKGPGVFIAGGAGVTPFIAILRALYRNDQINENRLILSNRTSRDIILREEFERMLGNQFINTLTEEDHPDYDNRRIDKRFLKDNISDFSRHFYVCGPPSFIEDITDALKQLNAKPDSIVFEE